MLLDLPRHQQRPAQSHPPSTNGRLKEETRPLRIKSDRQQRRETLASLPPKLPRILPHGDGVQVHYRVQQLGVWTSFGLLSHPLLQCAEVVSEMRHAGGLDA